MKIFFLIILTSLNLNCPEYEPSLLYSSSLDSDSSLLDSEPSPLDPSGFLLHPLSQINEILTDASTREESKANTHSSTDITLHKLAYLEASKQRAAALERLIRLHSRNKRTKCPLGLDCRYTYPLRADGSLHRCRVNDHLRVHFKDRRYYCKECLKKERFISFSQSSNTRSHIRVTHQDADMRNSIGNLLEK